jgi:uncharacterized protein
VNRLNKIKNIIKQNKREIEKKYKVKEIGVFGSFVRGEEKKGSDIDILVEFKEPIGLFEFMDLEEYLENIFGKKVNLVSKKALKPRIGQYILKEVMYI